MRILHDYRQTLRRVDGPSKSYGFTSFPVSVLGVYHFSLDGILRLHCIPECGGRPGYRPLGGMDTRQHTAAPDSGG